MSNQKRNIKIIIALLLALVIYISAPYGLAKAADHYEEKKESKDIAENLYTSIYKYFPYSSKAPQALGSLISLSNPEGESILITQHFTSVLTQSRTPDIERMDLYELLSSKYPDSEEAKFITLKIGQHYVSLGEFAKAEECFLEALEVDQENYIQSESNFELIKLYLKNNKAEKALSYIEKYRENYPDDIVGKMYLLEGDAYQILGDFKKAEETYKKVDQLEYDSDDGEEKDCSLYYQEKLDQRLLLNDVLEADEDQEKAKIQGNITKNGESIDNTTIYLIDENIEEWNFSAKDIEDYPAVAADKNGKYEFENIIPGKYSIGIVLNKEDLKGYTLVPEQKIYDLTAGEDHQVDLKLVPILELEKPYLSDNRSDINFKWEPVKGAQHYTVAIGWVKRDKEDLSFSSALIEENIADNKLSLSTEEILKDNCPQQRSENISLEADRQQRAAGDESELPEAGEERSPSLLHQNGKHEFIWSVKAYDENNKLITDSSGYEFFIDNKNLTTFIIADHGSKRAQEKKS